MGILLFCWRGAVAQLGERDNRTVEVRGSNPLSSTKLSITFLTRPQERVSRISRVPYQLALSPAVDEYLIFGIDWTTDIFHR